jgi:hypothetical protein
MLPSSAPARQQAHALVDRMTPLQISAFLELFESSQANVKPPLRHAPFCDELPVDADDASTVRALPPIRQGELPPRRSPANAYPSDSDTRLAAQRNRTGSMATSVA